MSERARGLRRAVIAAGIAAAALALPAIGATQEAEAARQALLSMRQRMAASGISYDSVRRARIAVFNDSLRAGGRLVRFNSAGMPPDEREWLTGGLEAAQRTLETRFGAAAPGLVDTNAWEVRTSAANLGTSSRELFAPLPGGRNVHLSGRLPIKSEDVAEVALDAAGAALARRHPTLERYAESMNLEQSAERYVRAARDLALGNSTLGRRCVAGAVGACRVVLSPARGASPLTVWFTREDHRAIIASSRANRARRDSIGVRMREACLGGEDDVCERVAERLQLTYPVRADVRATFAAHAVETGGEAGLARLEAAHDRFAEDPVGLLVHVSGVPEEQLITTWQRRLVAAATGDSQRPLAPFAVSAAFWCGLLLFGASRRRPR